VPAPAPTPHLPPLIIDNACKNNNNLFNLLVLLMAMKNKKTVNCCCVDCGHHHPPHGHHHHLPASSVHHSAEGSTVEYSYDVYHDEYEPVVAEITINPGAKPEEPVPQQKKKIETHPGREPNEIHLIITADFAPPCA
jgi:hypothetical protein